MTVAYSMGLWLFFPTTLPLTLHLPIWANAVTPQNRTISKNTENFFIVKNILSFTTTKLFHDFAEIWNNAGKSGKGLESHFIEVPPP
jgi:hypothetical protein